MRQGRNALWVGALMAGLLVASLAPAQNPLPCAIGKIGDPERALYPEIKRYPVAADPADRLAEATKEIEAWNDYLKGVKSSVRERDRMVDRLATVMLAHEHALVAGGPGTAKSSTLARLLDNLVDADTGKPAVFLSQGATEATMSEVHGPFSIQLMNAHDVFARNWQKGILASPTAFLDEFGRFRPDMRDSLLNVLEERGHRAGQELVPGNLRLALATSNSLLSTETDDAIANRFALFEWLPTEMERASSNAAIFLGQGKKTQIPRFTLQGLEKLHALMDDVEIPPEIVSLATVAHNRYREAVGGWSASNLEEYNKALSQGLRPDPPAVGSKTQSPRILEMMGNMLRANVVMGWAQSGGKRPLVATADDLLRAGMVLGLNGPDSQGFLDHLANSAASTPQDRSAIKAIQFERSAFQAALQETLEERNQALAESGVDEARHALEGAGAMLPEEKEALQQQLASRLHQVNERLRGKKNQRDVTGTEIGLQQARRFFAQALKQMTDGKSDAFKQAYHLARQKPSFQAPAPALAAATPIAPRPETSPATPPVAATVAKPSSSKSAHAESTPAHFSIRSVLPQVAETPADLSRLIDKVDAYTDLPGIFQLASRNEAHGAVAAGIAMAKLGDAHVPELFESDEYYRLPMDRKVLLIRGLAARPGSRPVDLALRNRLSRLEKRGVPAEQPEAQAIREAMDAHASGTWQKHAPGAFQAPNFETFAELTSGHFAAEAAAGPNISVKAFAGLVSSGDRGAHRLARQLFSEASPEKQSELFNQVLFHHPDQLKDAEWGYLLGSALPGDPVVTELLAQMSGTKRDQSNFAQNFAAEQALASRRKGDLRGTHIYVRTIPKTKGEIESRFEVYAEGPDARRLQFRSFGGNGPQKSRLTGNGQHPNVVYAYLDGVPLEIIPVPQVSTPWGWNQQEPFVHRAASYDRLGAALPGPPLVVKEDRTSANRVFTVTLTGPIHGGGTLTLTSTGVEHKK